MRILILIAMMGVLANAIARDTPVFYLKANAEVTNKFVDLIKKLNFPTAPIAIESLTMFSIRMEISGT